MHQLYSLLAIALRKDEGQESEDRFKCCLSSPELSPAERKIKKNIEEISAQKSGRRRDEAPKRVVSLLACHHVRLEYLKLLPYPVGNTASTSRFINILLTAVSCSFDLKSKPETDWNFVLKSIRNHGNHLTLALNPC